MAEGVGVAGEVGLLYGREPCSRAVSVLDNDAPRKPFSSACFSFSACTRRLVLVTIRATDAMDMALRPALAAGLLAVESLPLATAVAAAALSCPASDFEPPLAVADG